MNTSHYRTWMQRAFLYVEGALLQRSAEDSPTKITEDFVRGSLVDGLKVAKPLQANDVRTEVDTPWNKAPDINDATRKFGSGRSRQHDVAVKSHETLAAVCEVKWLKKKDPNSILEDLWKSILTHGTATKEKDCCRTFLLIGGLKKPFQNTLKDLRSNGLPLRWSPQGRANVWPKPVRFGCGPLANKNHAKSCLINILKRRKQYHRTPPEAWWEMRCSVIARSWKTIRDAEWKIAIWEIDHRQPCSVDVIDWSGLGYDLP